MNATVPAERVYVKEGGGKYGGRVVGFYYKTQGGFFRAYDHRSGIGYGPIATEEEARGYILRDSKANDLIDCDYRSGVARTF